MERYDIAIIGTGPAGLEAAITAKIRNKKIILFGNKNLSLKVEKAHTIQNYLGLPDIGGEELKAAYEAHLKAMDIEITEDKINAVYAMGEYFALQGNGTNYEAQTVILATGVSTAKAYPGEEQFLGRGVSYCATCDAPLYRGKTAAIIGNAAPEQKIFIVCRTPKDVRRLVEAGVDLKEVNVGNMHFSEGKRAMTKKVYVDDEDMDDLKYLVSKGINVYAQDVPGDPKFAIE